MEVERSEPVKTSVNGFSRGEKIGEAVLNGDERVMEHSPQVLVGVVRAVRMQPFNFFFEVNHSTKRSERVVGEVKDLRDEVEVAVSREKPEDGN